MPETTVVVDLNEPVAYDDNGEPITLATMVARSLANRMWSEVDRDALRDLAYKAANITDETIRAHIEPLVRDALDADIEPEFGGKRVPLRQHIVDLGRKALTWRDGRYSSDSSLLTKLVKEEIDRTLTAELKKDLDAAKKTVRDAVKMKGAEMLAETIERLAVSR